QGQALRRHHGLQDGLQGGEPGQVTALLLAVSLLATPAKAQQVLNLSCVEALVAVGESRLAGVFAFVAEKDETSAFADLLVHDKGALKKFMAKADKDFK